MINELELPDSALTNEITDTGRWSVYHEIVFAHDGKFYKTCYSVGATEHQDERIWEYEENIECWEVELKEVLVKKWVDK